MSTYDFIDTARLRTFCVHATTRPFSCAEVIMGVASEIRRIRIAMTARISMSVKPDARERVMRWVLELKPLAAPGMRSGRPEPGLVDRQVAFQGLGRRPGIVTAAAAQKKDLSDRFVTPFEARLTCGARPALPGRGTPWRRVPRPPWPCPA